MNDLIIIPTYNEKENLGPLLEAIYEIRPDIHVLVVDDNSPDGTGQLVAEWAEAPQYEGRLFLLRRAGKLGLGTAYIAGFRWALARSYRRILEMDADFSHNPRYLPDLLAAAEEADLVLGSRYVPGGGVKNWGFWRRFLSRGGSLYARVLLGLPYQDLTGGFKCFRREVLETLDLGAVRSNGYSFQIELTYRAHCKGFKIKEVPIVFEDREVGKSKMSKHIFLEAVLMVWKLRMEGL
ncbi:polyprenol monophosphomannose synthase [Anaeromusa sp.]|uniref:polyprenol monophosphomannose synthase n=1 Tax=Anaeromusa sp. TaxID=1872520 RepID=UPI0026278FEC|nr:polyprenol monophosphomannose synthase [Anaeromusa sp.]MDD3157495.1 polyprenol monophosphomannose synthase [Anaeromusa sp.]MEA4833702.1 polyprenol monophosphomannose synthase [Anaeromusa sp.]NCB75724.1 polyprenol monophosphomannose synthase [Negativicutes bacterium]